MIGTVQVLDDSELQGCRLIGELASDGCLHGEFVRDLCGWSYNHGGKGIAWWSCRRWDDIHDVRHVEWRVRVPNVHLDPLVAEAERRLPNVATVTDAACEERPFA